MDAQLSSSLEARVRSILLAWRRPGCSILLTRRADPTDALKRGQGGGSGLVPFGQDETKPHVRFCLRWVARPPRRRLSRARCLVAHRSSRRAPPPGARFGEFQACAEAADGSATPLVRRSCGAPPYMPILKRPRSRLSRECCAAADGSSSRSIRSSRRRASRERRSSSALGRLLLQR